MTQYIRIHSISSNNTLFDCTININRFSSIDIMSDSDDSDASFKAKGRKFSRQEENHLNDSLRKKPLKTAYITVEEEDGNIRHLPVSVDDGDLSNKQPILNSLAILGDLPPEQSPR